MIKRDKITAQFAYTEPIYYYKNSINQGPKKIKVALGMTIFKYLGVHNRSFLRVIYKN